MKTKNLLEQRSLSDPSLNKLSSIDLEPILEECMGDRQLLGELISLFDRNALEFIGASRIHLNNEDFSELERAAHKVKAGLAMMRTDGLHAIIVLIQKECDGDRDLKHLQFLCDCFAEDYPEVKAFIDLANARIQQK